MMVILQSPRTLRYVVSLYLLLALFFSRPVALMAQGDADSPQPIEDLRIDYEHERYQKLFHELENEHGFDNVEIKELFTTLVINPRVLELMDSQSEPRPYLRYLALFLTPAVVSAGKEKLAEHKELLDRVEEEFGVDREYIIAIWGIESRFGFSRGRYNVLQTLNTLFAAYPRRRPFFRSQLIHYLLLCRENNIDPHSLKGSYAGAFGQTQFIPSSFREYSVSYDGDAQRDIFESIPDIFASIANYLQRHRWVLDGPVYADIGLSLKSEELKKAYQTGRKAKIAKTIVARTQKVQLPDSVDDKPLIIFSTNKSSLLGGGKRYLAGYANYQALLAWNNSHRYAIAVSQLAMALSK